MTKTYYCNSKYGDLRDSNNFSGDSGLLCEEVFNFFPKVKEVNGGKYELKLSTEKFRGSKEFTIRKEFCAFEIPNFYWSESGRDDNRVNHNRLFYINFEIALQELSKERGDGMFSVFVSLKKVVDKSAKPATL